ncbi:MAG: hypothetical protein LBF60_06600 [Treponema sp.]|jgi:hypothetical protein|nr:hypothetical protein [Treponema sp.]
MGAAYSACFTHHGARNRDGKKLCLFRAFLFLLPPLVHAADTPYLIPQTVFVGDRATLVAPLGTADKNFQPRSIDTPETPDDLVLHTIVLERKGDNVQLAIEFTAYAPGDIEFPVIRAPGFPDFIGLKVTVASILKPSYMTPSSMTLSAPAPPLLAPGTTSLIYGSVAIVILLLIFGIGFRLFWTNRFANVRKRLFQRYLVISMKGFIAKLRKQQEKEGAPYDAALDLLSARFRRFLTRFTGIDCLAMSAAEFAGLEHGTPLSIIFRAWDMLRFNAESVSQSDIINALDDARDYISTLDKTEPGEKHGV